MFDLAPDARGGSPLELLLPLPLPRFVDTAPTPHGRPATCTRALSLSRADLSPKAFSQLCHDPFPFLLFSSPLHHLLLPSRTPAFALNRGLCALLSPTHTSRITTPQPQHPLLAHSVATHSLLPDTWAHSSGLETQTHGKQSLHPIHHAHPVSFGQARRCAASAQGADRWLERCAAGRAEAREGLYWIH
jgi:hypothetical protein